MVLDFIVVTTRSVREDNNWKGILPFKWMLQTCLGGCLMYNSALDTELER